MPCSKSEKEQIAEHLASVAAATGCSKELAALLADSQEQKPKRSRSSTKRKSGPGKRESLKCPRCERGGVRIEKYDRKDMMAVCPAPNACGWQMYLPDCARRTRDNLVHIVKKYGHDPERFVYNGAVVPKQ